VFILAGNWHFASLLLSGQLGVLSAAALLVGLTFLHSWRSFLGSGAQGASPEQLSTIGANQYLDAVSFGLENFIHHFFCYWHHCHILL